ncbi:peroxisomal membrane protein 11C-like [Sycon ciliatum]|uniref:peroxisomal membrane protein 11C-like n=1 Tax=Sycon ciliatum TaxID=27933 RepID=UPI0020AAC989|eukprot:scpid60525/ scgid35322/ Peroxisomal membrane protein 11C; Peroxin-11C; Peroxisomal biogenesis factor 11C; Protein PEX11 homolog gamma
MDGATVAEFLETYRGRDKIYRLISYFSQFVASGLDKLGHTQSASRLESLGSALSACRVVLRLGDDLAMWQVTKAYGLGSQVGHPVLRMLGIVQNVFDQLYYPLEHIAWACDVGVLKRPSAFWWVASIAAWAGSLLTSLITKLVKLTQLNLAIARERTATLPSSTSAASSAHPIASSDDEDDDEDEEEDGGTAAAAASVTYSARQPQGKVRFDTVPASTLRARGHSSEYASLHRRNTPRPTTTPQQPSLKTQRRHLLLELVQHLADFGNAVHWMPPGFLWGGKLSQLAVGFNGVLSSLIGLYLMLARYHQQLRNRNAN